jgi:hypothetical protein
VDRCAERPIDATAQLADEVTMERHTHDPLHSPSWKRVLTFSDVLLAVFIASTLAVSVLLVS